MIQSHVSKSKQKQWDSKPIILLTTQTILHLNWTMKVTYGIQRNISSKGVFFMCNPELEPVQSQTWVIVITKEHINSLFHFKDGGPLS